MIASLLLVTCVIGTIALVRERGSLRACYKPGLYGGGCGVANGIANLLVMVLANRLSASLLYPTISADNIVLTYVILLETNLRKILDSTEENRIGK